MRRPPLRPVVWQPPPIPDRARAPSGPRPLPPLRRLEVDGNAPEDVVVDGAGRVVTGVDDGRLLRIDPDGRVEVVADTGGRPLGVELLGDGRLLVCDARRGLLAVDPETGAVEVLVDRVAGEPLRFCNNAAVAADGTVYFSDSSRRFWIDHWRADLLEHSGTGRLLRRDPGGAVRCCWTGCSSPTASRWPPTSRSWRWPRPAPTASPGGGLRVRGRGGPTCWPATCPASPTTSRPGPAG